MISNKKILALLPARGGSKGCPGKNSRILLDKPLVAWTVEAASRSKYIDRLIVSTDSEEIAAAARQYGADVPFLRPREHATDQATMAGVINHAMRFVESREGAYDYLALLQPTSPLRTAVHLDKALELAIKRRADSVVSITETEHTPLLSNTLPPDGRMNKFIPRKYRNKNRQELPRYYRLNGAIFIAAWPYWVKHEDWFGKKSYAYIMDRASSVDIDTAEDFFLAECLLKKAGL